MAQKLAPQANSLYGTPSPLNKQALPAIAANRAPTTSDIGYQIGQVWIYVGSAAYVLTNVAGGVATWSAVGGSGAAASVLSLTASSDITTTGGNVIISGAGKQLRVEGGAVTDFIGRATLASGTVTVANTNIAATDRIFVNRSSAGASTALGVFTTSISAGASFTITALKPADATTETGDISVVDYFIVRQL